jgi:hypothetical protein
MDEFFSRETSTPDDGHMVAPKHVEQLLEEK